MKFKLSEYIIPSVISMVLVGTYTNIDGFFIGNVTGDDGLAAINIVWPIVAFITSLGTGIGIGGSVMLNNARGRNECDEEESIKKTIIMLLLMTGIVAGAFFVIFDSPLLYLMGAQGSVFVYAKDYAEIVCAGAVFQVMGSGLIALLRNEHKTYFSMVCCIVGLVVHLILDMLLVEEYKLGGVAASTVISQAVIMILGLSGLKWRAGTRARLRHMMPILVGSTAPFGINFIPSVVLLFTNYFALQAGGTVAVSAYAVMSYAVYTIDYVFQGVCDGAQPILSFLSGTGEKKQKERVMKQSIMILAAFTFLFLCMTPVLIGIMPRLFATSREASEMMRHGFIIYAFSYPFKAVVRYICSYYYACGKTGRSNLLIYIDPIFFTPLLLFILPKFVGIDGIWLSLTLTQMLIAIIAIVPFASDMRKESEVEQGMT